MEFSQDSMLSKLTLLFMLEKMDMPLTKGFILDICTRQNDWMNYMECIDIFYQLMQANFIFKTDGEGDEERYTISVEGQNCLDHFYQKINAELREQIIEFIKNNRLHFKKSQEYVADYSKNSDGSYLLTLKIRSHTVNYPMFEIKIAVNSRQSAIEAVKKWRENAHLIYEQTYENLVNFDNE